MPDEAVRVVWEVAEDERFARIVARADTEASPLRAHAVHVEVDGLRPARPYWYRFRVGTWESPVGRTRTAPEPTADVDRVRLAFASCQHWEHGYFTAYRHLAREDLDVVLFLGDYIYEYATLRESGAAGGRPGDHHARRLSAALRAVQDRPRPPGGARGVPVHRHLGRSRGRQRLRQRPLAGRRPARVVPAPPRRGLSGLLRAHAAAPPSAGRAVRTCRSTGRCPTAGWLDLSVLDTRQYRTPKPCGGRAERALRRRPRRRRDHPRRAAARTGCSIASPTSPARWHVLAQQVMMAPPRSWSPGPPQEFSMDKWTAYQPDAQAVFDFLGTRQAVQPGRAHRRHPQQLGLRPARVALRDPDLADRRRPSSSAPRSRPAATAPTISPRYQADPRPTTRT